MSVLFVSLACLVVFDNCVSLLRVLSMFCFVMFVESFRFRVIMFVCLKTSG